MSASANAAEKRVKVFLVDQITEMADGSLSDTISYGYTSGGRIKSIKTVHTDTENADLNDTIKETIKYDKKGRFKSRLVHSYKYNVTEKYSYKYDKKGHVKSIFEEDSPEISIKYNNSGKCTRYIENYAYIGAKNDYKYTYNKSGRLSSINAKKTGDDPSSYKSTLKYDKGNNIISVKETGTGKKKYSTTYKYKNNYKNKLLVKQTDSHVLTNSITRNIKYKKVILTKSKAKVAQAQQKWIINKFYLGDDCPPLESFY